MKAQLKQVDPEIFRIQGKKHYSVPIDGYPGYFVTTLGKVISCVNGYRGHQSQTRGTSVPVILKQKTNNSGYRQVILVGKSKKPKHEFVHRLVAFAFLEPPSDAPNPNDPMRPLERRIQVNHIDGRKSNNKVSNLEWNSPKENKKHQELIKELKSLKRQRREDHLGITSK